MTPLDGWPWTATLGLHVAAGVVALVVGPAAMAARKGARWHRWWGRTFVLAMATVAATAVTLAAARPSLFLALVAVFSFYLAFTGWRAPARRRPGATAWPDWIGAAVAASAGVALVGWALVPRAGGRPATWVVAVVFGALGVLIALREARALRAPAADPHAWRYRHMGNMLGAYIATVSAFSVVNLALLPPLARWLWPTLLGVPLVVAWIRRERRRLSGRRAAAAPLAG